MTLDDIIKKCKPLQKDLALYVKFRSIKTGKQDDVYPFIAAKAYSTKRRLPDGRMVTNVNPETYIAVIMVIDNKKHVKVSCSCPSFNYGGFEYSLAKKGAADIQYGDGSAPDIKNPKRIPGMCKHLVALRSYVKTKYKF